MANSETDGQTDRQTDRQDFVTLTVSSDVLPLASCQATVCLTTAGDELMWRSCRSQELSVASVKQPSTDTHTRSIREHSSFTKGRTGKTAFLDVCVCVCVCVRARLCVCQYLQSSHGLHLSGPLTSKEIKCMHTPQVSKPRNVSVEVGEAVFCICVYVCTPQRRLTLRP